MRITDVFEDGAKVRTRLLNLRVPTCRLFLNALCLCVCVCVWGGGGGRRYVHDYLI